MIETLLLILLSQPVSKYDSAESYDARRVRLQVVSEAIVVAAKSDRGKVAFLTAQMVHESALRSDVQRCECPRNQCDAGRAHGPWQLHLVPALGDEAWHGWCGTSYESVYSGAKRVLWTYRASDPAGSFARQGGHLVRPTEPWVQRRVATMRRIAGQL
jgi:hypothetical protein